MFCAPFKDMGFGEYHKRIPLLNFFVLIYHVMYARISHLHCPLPHPLSAGQTIFHAHIQIIPRRDGDTPNPTGGVRGVIPDKMCYSLEE